jgi:potassium/hydrogen antiporter
MFEQEPAPTALLFAAFGVLMALSALFSRAAQRIGIPVVLVFLVIGMIAGAEGFFGFVFDDYGFAFRIGMAALVLILFDGGLNTPLESVRQGIRPAAILATFGVVGTALLVAVGAWLLGFDWTHALLLGAIVSSTDAAAVFSVLRGSGLQLKRRVGVTLEIESGSNDPMALILTTSLAAAIVGQSGGLTWWIAFDVLIQLGIGAILGLGVGFGGRWLLGRARLETGGLYPVLTIAIALIAFGLPTVFLGSGFLAVYIAAVIIGNGPVPYRSGLLRVHDAVAWMAQISMFLVLGLLVTPTRLLEVAWVGIVLSLVLAFIARPVVVTLLLLPFRYSARETAFISWVGLRGAVPIILSIFPVILGVEGAETLFHVVCAMVVLNTLVPGATVRWITDKLGLTADEPPPPSAVLEVQSTQLLDGELKSYYIDAASAACGARIADLPFPEGSSALLVVRGRELLAPRGDTQLKTGDHLHVFYKPQHEALMQLLFGRSEEG